MVQLVICYISIVSLFANPNGEAGMRLQTQEAGNSVPVQAGVPDGINRDEREALNNVAVIEDVAIPEFKENYLLRFRNQVDK